MHHSKGQRGYRPIGPAGPADNCGGTIVLDIRVAMRPVPARM
jgi:hypothetical protein